MSTLAPYSPAPSIPSRVLVGLFLAALVAPGIDMLLRDAAKRGPEREGRAVRPAPVWVADPRAIFHYPEKFEGHFNDTLGLRDHMLRINSLRALNIFHDSPSSDVCIGKDDWLFFLASKSFETYRGLLPFTPTQLAEWQIALEARRDMAASIGAAYMFVIGPNKEAIYPDYLPEGVEQLGPTRLDQLIEWMSAHSDVQFLDLRPALRRARSEDRPKSYLYFEEGTHWNGRGCLVAAQEIKRAAITRFPEIGAAPSPNWIMTTDAYPETWREKMYLGIPPNRTRDNWIAHPSELHAVITADWPAVNGRNYAIPGSSLPSMLMFHDSFGPLVVQLLSEHFSTARSRDVHAFDTVELLNDPPDLVVELCVERVLVEAYPTAMLPTPLRGVVALNADRGHKPQQRRFDASADVRLKLDLERAATLCGTSGQLGLEVVNDAVGAGLALTRQSAFDSLILPALVPGTARDLLLLIELDSLAVSSAELFFQTQGQVDWPAEQKVVVPLTPGKNRHWVPLHHSYQVERLRLRPGSMDGERTVLRRFEVRGVERP